MEIKRIVGIGVAVFAFSACNEAVEERINTVYEEEARKKQKQNISQQRKHRRAPKNKQTNQK